MTENTTIRVSLETRDALKALGAKGQSYDTIIYNLIQNDGLVAELESEKGNLELRLHQMEVANR